jgi:uncharacterized protein GlcG (DUF336 family)
MTLTLAEECVLRVKRKAETMGIDVAIAVVDYAGELIAYARMGEKRGGLREKPAIAKARTAAAYGWTTKQAMENWSTRPGNYYIVAMSGMYPEEFWAGPGGAPITFEGEIIGGVGVSGSSPENDHACVMEALEGIEAAIQLKC